MKQRYACITLAALSLSLCLPAVAVAAEEAPVPSVTGNPPADHPFGKIKPGMSFDEAVAILGKPTAEIAYCTGKHRIPFYFGNDKAYTEYFYKGQGKVYFYTRFSSFSMFHGAVNSCTPKEPFELASVEYNPSETGIPPKEGEEVKKEPADAAK